MQRPQPSGSSPNPPDPQTVDVEEFERSLADVEQALVVIKQRYTQVQQDIGRQSELRQRLDQIKQESRQIPQLRVELRQIKEQLEAIEINLESQLFSWGSLREPFWQAVRFGGLGVVVGWILKYLAG